MMATTPNAATMMATTPNAATMMATISCLPHKTIMMISTLRITVHPRSFLYHVFDHVFDHAPSNQIDYHVTVQCAPVLQLQIRDLLPFLDFINITTQKEIDGHVVHQSGSSVYLHIHMSELSVRYEGGDIHTENTERDWFVAMQVCDLVAHVLWEPREKDKTHVKFSIASLFIDGGYDARPSYSGVSPTQATTSSSPVQRLLSLPAGLDSPAVDMRVSQTRTGVLVVLRHGEKFDPLVGRRGLVKADFDMFGTISHMYMVEDEEEVDRRGEGVTVIIEYAHVSNAATAISYFNNSTMVVSKYVTMATSKYVCVRWAPVHVSNIVLKIQPAEFLFDQVLILNMLTHVQTATHAPVRPQGDAQLQELETENETVVLLPEREKKKHALCCSLCALEHALSSQTKLALTATPKIIFTVNPADRNSPGLVVDLGFRFVFIFKSKSEELPCYISGDILKLSAVSCFRHEPATVSTIIPPIGASFLYRFTSPNTTNISVEAPGIALYLSPANTQLALNIVKAIAVTWYPMYPSTLGKPRVSSGMVWDQHPHRTPAIFPHHPTPMLKPDVTITQKLTLDLNKIEIAWLSTVYGISEPRILVSVKVNIQLENWSHRLAGRCECHFASALYRPRYNTWEPFIISSSDTRDRPRPIAFIINIRNTAVVAVDLATVTIAGARTANRSQILVPGTAVY